MAVIVSSVAGTLTDGQSVTISGSGFGTGPSGVEFLGGASGNIEAGSVGSAFSKTNWSTDGDFQIPVYSSTQYHSGSKSILCNPDSDNLYNSILKYAFSSGITSSGKLFLSTWIRFTKSSGADWHQWKMYRFSNQNTIEDGYNQLVVFSWDNANGPQLCVDPNVIPYTSLGVSPIATQNTWFRLDIYIECDVTNGSFKITKYIPGTSPDTDTISPYPTHRSGSAWNYLIFQNYIGNTSPGTATIYLDDIYISPNSQARVELGNASTFATCTHFEIQPSSSWAASSITTTLNIGSFGPTDTVYVYIIDQYGNYNSTGYEIELSGSGSGYDTTPAQFTFTDITDATLSTVYTSNQITVSGIDTVVGVDISNGTYSKNGAAYTSNAGTCVNGDTFTVRHTSSSSYSTATNTVLLIGGITDTYTTTTLADPSIPEEPEEPVVEEEMGSWPATLPQELIEDSFEETMQSLIISTDMEVGPPKTRKRLTANFTPIKGSIIVTKAQRAIFLTFFHSTIAGGAIKFTWEHPITGSTVKMKIIGPPKITPLGGDYFKIDMDLHILPTLTVISGA
jgi:hypothetical protein